MGKILENTRETFIYSLNCPINKEVRYIGKTVNVNKRFNQHLHKAIKNPTTYRDNWINSLLKDNLKPIIVVLETTIWELSQEKEINWISKFNKLTNISKGGEGNLGMKFTENHKKRISESHRENAKCVYQYNLNGKFIKKYRSPKDAAEENNLKTVNICQTCSLEKKSHGGYIWSYKNKNIININDYKHKIVNRPKFTKEYYTNLYGIKIKAVYKNENFIFNSVTEASEKTGVSKTSISMMINGKRKSNRKNYKFEKL